MSEAARSHRSDIRVEPTLDPPAGIRTAGGPLAELAQLVGQDDPFRAMFRQPRTPASAAVEPVMESPAHVDHPIYAVDHAETNYSEDVYQTTEDAQALGLRPSVHPADEWPHADAEAGHWDESYDGHPDDQTSEGGYYEHGDVQPGELPVAASHYEAPPLTPDLWAGHGSEGHEASGPSAASDGASGDAKATRRPLVVLMAVLALTGGGLAATFLARSGSPNVVAVAGSAPTILAAAGPSKIKQTDGTSDTTPEDADAALLNKKGGASTGAVKVVNSQEQPIDLSQLPKPAGGSNDASDAAMPFPAPKKVKTFLVRPDGSLVGSAKVAAADPVRSAVPQFAAGSASDAAPVPAARPSSPKTGTHAAVTPKAPPTSIADLTASDAVDNKQAASPGAKAGTSKPVEVADASANDVTASTSAAPGSNFALQLAASPSEQDARGAFVKLQKKYSELSGYQPTVKKVDNGQKTVYRLRVGNLNQDQAKSLCGQLQASGGSCFVVHN